MPSAPKRRLARRKPAKPKTSREKVEAHRRRLRAQGLRPLQIWVPDTRSRRFANEARRQSLAVASSAGAADDQAFVAALGELSFE
ncbi:MAG: antitoxin MazE family protein [Deltaproteobacteria bacterium]|nr:antitoxin MazE family protein [Deltaproteobacteria bacterium]